MSGPDRQRTYYLFESWPFRLEVTGQAVNVKVRFRGSVSIPLEAIVDVQQRRGSISIVTTQGVYPRWGLSTPDRADAAARAIAEARADAIRADAVMERKPTAATEKPPAEGADYRSASREGPWSAANAERDAGLFLRAVLYSMFTPDVSPSAKAYATVVGRAVVEGDDEHLLALLTAITYFVAKVHFLQGDPFADPAYVSYSRLLAAHFMKAAAECLPGPNPPSDEIRRANGVRLAAETSKASMALVEALDIVGTSATESAAASHP